MFLYSFFFKFVLNNCNCIIFSASLQFQITTFFAFEFLQDSAKTQWAIFRVGSGSPTVMSIFIQGNLYVFRVQLCRHLSNFLGIPIQIMQIMCMQLMPAEFSWVEAYTRTYLYTWDRKCGLEKEIGVEEIFLPPSHYYYMADYKIITCFTVRKYAHSLKDKLT